MNRLPTRRVRAQLRPLVWLLAIAVPLGGICLVGAPATAADPSTGSIGGTVTDRDGVPLERISVTAYSWRADDGVWAWAEATTTDEDGGYDLSGLAPDTYHLGFADASGDGGYLPEFWNDATTVETGDDVEVVAGVTAAGTDVQLAEEAHIRGTVTGSEGQPLAGIRAAALTWDADQHSWVDAGMSSQTDANGAYDVSLLPPGTYRLQFIDYSGDDHLQEFWNDARTVEAATDITVTAGATVVGKDAQLAEPAHIRGTVTGHDGAPLASALVEAFRWDAEQRSWTSAGSAWTGDTGDYDIGSLFAGTYHLRFTDYSGHGYATEYWDDAVTLGSAAGITVEPGMSGESVDAQLTSSSQLAGRVTDTAGEAVEGVRVAAYRWDDRRESWIHVAAAYTSRSGTYWLNDVRGGTYRLWFTDFSDTGYLAEHSDDIDVIPGQTAWDDAELTRGGRLVGRITGPEGEPIDGGFVTAYRLDDGTWRPVTGALTDAGGRYDLSRLTTGTYRLRFDGFGGYRTEFWKDAATLGNAATIPVTAGETSTLQDVQLDGSAKPAVANVTAPTITGTAKVGSKVTANAGTWTPSPTVAYQWLVGGKAVGTGSSYTPVATDAGKSLQLKVSASAVGHVPGTATSAVTRIASGTLKATAAPMLSGTARKGATLSVSTGRWPTKVTTKIQWYAGGKSIAGATGTSLRLTGKTLTTVAGKAITAKLTVSAPGYTTWTTTLKAAGTARR